MWILEQILTQNGEQWHFQHTFWRQMECIEFCSGRSQLKRSSWNLTDVRSFAACVGGKYKRTRHFLRNTTNTVSWAGGRRSTLQQLYLGWRRFTHNGFANHSAVQNTSYGSLYREPIWRNSQETRLISRAQHTKQKVPQEPRRFIGRLGVLMELNYFLWKVGALRCPHWKAIPHQTCTHYRVTMALYWNHNSV
mgnify:CR=1 FL=1